MAEIKTKVTKESVTAFLKCVDPEEKRKGSLAFLKFLKKRRDLPLNCGGRVLLVLVPTIMNRNEAHKKVTGPLRVFLPASKALRSI